MFIYNMHFQEGDSIFRLYEPNCALYFSYICADTVYISLLFCNKCEIANIIIFYYQNNDLNFWQLALPCLIISIYVFSQSVCLLLYIINVMLQHACLLFLFELKCLNMITFLINFAPNQLFRLKFANLRKM